MQSLHNAERTLFDKDPNRLHLTQEKSSNGAEWKVNHEYSNSERKGRHRQNHHRN